MLITTRVPVVICVGTMVRTPFDSMAGLNEPEAVWPFMAGSVSVISSVTFGRDFHGDRNAFVHGQADHHAFLEVFLGVAHHVGRHLHLVVGFLVHEVEAVGILVEKAELVVLDMGALDLVGGLVALRGLHAVGNPAHIDLGGGGAFAGMKVFRGEDDIELAVDVDDIALAELAGDDLHDNDP